MAIFEAKQNEFFLNLPKNAKFSTQLSFINKTFYIFYYLNFNKKKIQMKNAIN